MTAKKSTITGKNFRGDFSGWPEYIPLIFSSVLPAVNLLFFYWPALNPTPAERKDIVDR